MTAMNATVARRTDWQKIGFLSILVLPMLFRLLEAVASMLVPWFPQISSSGPNYNAEIHIWHEAVFGVGSGLFAGTAIGLLKRSKEKPMLLQFLLLLGMSAILLEIVQIRAGRAGIIPFTIVESILLLLLVGFYPGRAELLKFAKPVIKPLLALSLVTALVLVPDIWANLQLQISGEGGEHLTFNHWLWGTVVDICLVVAGILSATGRRGWQWLGILVGIAFLYLGPAAMATQEQAGSWGRLGIVSTLLGAGFIAAVFIENKKRKTISPD